MRAALATALLTAVLLAAIACGRPPGRAEPPRRDALGVPLPDAGPPADAAPARRPVVLPTLARVDHALCFVEGRLHRCVNPMRPEDPRAVSRAWEHRPTFPDDSRWHVETDGSVRIQLLESSDPEAPRVSKEDEARMAVAKKLPPLLRTVETPQGVCGLTPKGEVVCWPEPLQNVDLGRETPIVSTPARVPDVANVRELFLQEWSNLCVVGDAGRREAPSTNVFCSKPAPLRTDLCVRRGLAARCGASLPALADSAYDPRKLLERPLAPVPDLAGAHDLVAYGSLTFYGHSEPGRVHLAVMREGGCAIDGAGAVRCFERDPCPKASSPWRTTRIEGLPARIARLSLSDEEGYALDADGRLFVWPRSADECKTSPVTAALHLEGVAAVLAGYFIVEAEPMFGALVCTVMKEGGARCWRHRKEAPQPVALE